MESKVIAYSLITSFTPELVNLRPLNTSPCLMQRRRHELKKLAYSPSRVRALQYCGWRCKDFMPARWRLLDCINFGGSLRKCINIWQNMRTRMTDENERKWRMFYVRVLNKSKVCWWRVYRALWCFVWNASFVTTNHRPGCVARSYAEFVQSDVVIFFVEERRTSSLN